MYYLYARPAFLAQIRVFIHRSHIFMVMMTGASLPPNLGDEKASYAYPANTDAVNEQ